MALLSFAGALNGLGQAGYAASFEVMRNEIQAQKAERLAQLQGDIQRRNTAESQTRAGEIDRQNMSHKYDLENRDRGLLAAKVSEYAKGRDETLPEDVAGPVGRVTPSIRDVGEFGAKAAMAAARPEIAKQYRDAGGMSDIEQLEARHRQAIELKQSEGSPSETRARTAQAAYADAHAVTERGRPEREASRYRNESDRLSMQERMQSARTLAQTGEKLVDNAKDLDKAFREKWMGGEPKEPEARARYFAERKEITDMRNQGMSLINEGKGMLRSGGDGGGRPQSGGTPSPASIARAKETGNRKGFDEAYGAGAFDRYIGSEASGKPAVQEERELSPPTDRTPEGRRIEPKAANSEPSYTSFDRNFVKDENGNFRYVGSGASAASKNIRGLLSRFSGRV